MLDNPVYRVCIEESKHPGYVKVRSIEDPSVFSTKTLSTDDPLSPQTISEEEDEGEDPRTVETSRLLEARRKSYDEPSPLNLPPPIHRPASAVKRTQSFGAIAEDEEVESPGIEMMRDLARHLGETLGPDNYLRPRQLGPSSWELSRTGSGPDPQQRPEPVSPTASSSQNMNFPARNHHQEAGEAVKGRQGKTGLLAPPAAEGESSKRSSRKRESVGSESDYGYVRSTYKPIAAEEKEGRHSIISNNCFLHRDVAIYEEDEDEEQPYPLPPEMKKRIYLSSRRMMLFFSNQFYEIARRLGKSHLTSSARVLAPNILCKEMLEDSYKEQSWFYTPSIEIPFVPMDICLEFFFRKRLTMTHKMTRVKYQWPSQDQMDDIKRLGCNIAPVGFQHPRKDMTNPDTEIEWEVFYTKAEQYLARSFTHPKVRVYLFCLIIFKCYFQQFDGIKEKHLRHILYRWE